MSFSRQWRESVRLVALLLSSLLVSEGVASAQTPLGAGLNPGVEVRAENGGLVARAKLTLTLPQDRLGGSSRRDAINIPQRYNPQTGAANPSSQQPGRRFGKYTIITILAGAAIVGVAVANRNGNGDPVRTVQSTTITTGTVSVGTPR